MRCVVSKNADANLGVAIAGNGRSAVSKGSTRMPIEFRCVTCQKLLRIADDVAGKKARCPDCGTIQEARPSVGTVSAPLPSMAPANPFSSATELPTRPTNPFFEHGAAGPSTPQASANPYLAPFSAGYRLPLNREAIRAKLQFPAIGMLVVAALGITMQLLSVLMVLLAGARAPRGQQFVPNLIGPGLWLAVGFVIVLGAVKMQRLESYSLAITAGVLSVIPCTPCCALTIPFGIWSLVVLLDPQVRAAFSQPVELTS